MLQAILNKSWQHITRHQLYGHLPPIMKTIQVRWTRHAGHELISDVLLWTPTYGRAKAGWPAWTYIQQLCVDTGCSPEDLPEAMNDREKWRERVRDIRARGTTWWWWWHTINVSKANERKWFHTKKGKKMISHRKYHRSRLWRWPSASCKWYPAGPMKDADYADDLVLLANTPAQAESLLHSLEQAARGFCLYVNSDKTEFMF